jgi:hypothetical protein
VQKFLDKLFSPNSIRAKTFYGRSISAREYAEHVQVSSKRFVIQRKMTLKREICMTFIDGGVIDEKWHFSLGSGCSSGRLERSLAGRMFELWWQNAMILGSNDSSSTEGVRGSLRKVSI